MEKDNNIMSGKGEDDVDWITSNGAHIPIKEGETPKEAVMQRSKSSEDIKKDQPTVPVSIEDNTKHFKEQLQQVLNGSFDKYKDTLALGSTPQIFIEKANLPDLPLCMTYEKAYLSMNYMGEILGNYHNLGIDTLSQLPMKLQDPLYIFKSNNQNRVEAVVDLIDKKGNKVFVSVEMNTSKRIQKEYKQVNLVVTAFGTKENYISKRLSTEKILYKKIN